MSNFTGVCIVTQQMQAQRDFYHQVLQLEPQGDETFSKFTSQGLDLSFYLHQELQQIKANLPDVINPGESILEFRVTNVDHLYERLQALNMPIVKPPTTQPWGLRSVWCRDPDGNLVNFYTDSAPLSATGTA